MKQTKQWTSVPNDLLSDLRIEGSLRHNIQASAPGLQIEDAFQAPSWFCDQDWWIRDPQGSNSFVYNLPIYLRIRGPLQVPALVAAIQTVQRVHQSLRSIYRPVNERLIQVVLRCEPTPVVQEQLLLAEEEENVESALRDYAYQEALKPFDLGNEPAFRARVVRCSDKDHALLITTHHLVCDDWSTGIITRDIFQAYWALVSGEPVPATKPEFQYSEFIRWHWRQMTEEALTSRVSFWRNYLNGKGESHHLVTDHAQPAKRSWSGAVQREILPTEITNSLKRLAQREHVSLFMVLLAGFQCVLFRHSGNRDIAVGICTANRPLTQMEGVVGRFANDLIIRTDFSGNPNFREQLNRVRTQALTVYSYQDLPFARLVAELEPNTTPGCTPLFQTMFILQDAPKDQLSCPDLEVTPLAFDAGTAKYDLCVLLNLQQGLEVALEYNTTLFKPQTIARLMQQYKNVLQEMASDPTGRVEKSTAPSFPFDTEQKAIVAASHHSAESSRTVRSELVEIWKESFELPEVGLDDDFFELGGDSLLASRVFAAIHKTFRVKIPIVTLVQAPTIQKLATFIQEATSAPHVFRCSVLLQKGNGLRPPLFCAHGQSGNLLMYRGFTHHLGPDQPVFGLQPLGLDGNERPLERIAEMSSLYLQEIQEIQSHGPYFLAGYCMGGLIAFEMAKQLHQKGHSVGLVALIDTYNVGMMKISPLDSVLFVIQKCWFGWKHFLRIDRKYKLTYLKRRLIELQTGTSRVSEANEVAALSYVPSVYPGRILHVYPARQYSRYQRPELAWDGLASGGVEEYPLPIYPGQMFDDDSARVLAHKIRGCIDRELAKRTRPRLDDTNHAISSAS